MYHIPPMMTLTEIQAALSDRNIREVARRTELDADTIYRYARGEVVDPPLRTVRILSDYLTAPVVGVSDDT